MSATRDGMEIRHHVETCVRQWRQFPRWKMDNAFRKERRTGSHNLQKARDNTMVRRKQASETEADSITAERLNETGVLLRLCARHECRAFYELLYEVRMTLSLFGHLYPPRLQKIYGFEEANVFVESGR